MVVLLAVTTVAKWVGSLVCFVGCDEGCEVGRELGLLNGCFVGSDEGCDVGFVGSEVGWVDGCEDG